MPQTKKMFNDQMFGMMKPTAYIINCSRGPLIDTDALVRALDAKKIAGCALDTTDPEPLPSEEAGLEKRPEAQNLVGIYAALAETTVAAVLGQFGNANFSTFKTALVDLAVARLGPICTEMKRLQGDQKYLDDVLKDGADRARVVRLTDPPPPLATRSWR